MNLTIIMGQLSAVREDLTLLLVNETVHSGRDLACRKFLVMTA